MIILIISGFSFSLSARHLAKKILNDRDLLLFHRENEEKKRLLNFVIKYGQTEFRYTSTYP